MKIESQASTIVASLPFPGSRPLVVCRSSLLLFLVWTALNSFHTSYTNGLSTTATLEFAPYCSCSTANVILNSENEVEAFLSPVGDGLYQELSRDPTHGKFVVDFTVTKMKFSIAAASSLLSVLASAKQCQELTIPIQASARNGVFDLTTPGKFDLLLTIWGFEYLTSTATDIDVTNFILDLTQQSRNYTQEILTGVRYNISQPGQSC